MVVSVFKESPADRAGVRPGDIITYVDDDPLDGLALQQVIRKLRGPTGSSMRLRLRRKGVDRPIDIAVSREIVRQHAVVTRAIDNVAYVRVTQFSNQATDELRQGITALQSKIPFGNLKGYIFDLRNNEGGLLDQSISVADAFLEQGEIVTTRARNPDEAQRFDAKPGDLIGGKPLIVLINGKTAGVSEIVAGALQDHRRATLLGSRTFGYGSVQTISPLESGNGALRLTTARYFTPSGRSIQAMGIVPDIQVLQDVPEDARSDADSKGEAALRAHLKGEGREETGSQSYVPPDPRDDKALQMAIGLLRGVRTHPAFRPNSKAVGAK